MLDITIHEKRFKTGRKPILEDCRLTIATGELVAIIGPSGAGKTSLMRIVAGLDQQYRGEILLDHQPLGQQLPIGVVFQKELLMPWLTILDNMLLVLGNASRENIERIHAILADVGLENVAAQYPHQLSGGMLRRAALARAFVINPSLLLMDEPFVSLDEPNVMMMHALLKKLRDKIEVTTLFITHQLNEALTLADRVVFLSTTPGHIIKSIPVNLVKERDLHHPDVTKLAESILNEHPNILRGIAD